VPPAIATVLDSLAASFVIHDSVMKPVANHQPRQPTHGGPISLIGFNAGDDLGSGNTQRFAKPQEHVARRALQIAFKP